MYLAQNLKYLRERKGLSQREFSADLGLSRATVGNWETGERKPDIEMIIRLAEYFGVSLDDLVLSDLKSHLPLFIRNIRFLQKKYEISDKELALLMGIKKGNLEQCLAIGVENFVYCQENKSRLAEFFGVSAWELHLKDLSKEAKFNGKT